jgi:hypothetical protein
MALHVTPGFPTRTPLDTVESTREQIIELVGRRTDTLSGPDVEEGPPVLSLQLQVIDNFVEMIRMRTEIAEKDLRITTLADTVRTWRERVGIEQAARRRDADEAREREREIVSLLHQQMQVTDAATAELERIRALSWWRRLRG